jgi:hypothetical protein
MTTPTPKDTWQTLRTLSAQAAEGTTEPTSSFVNFDNSSAFLVDGSKVPLFEFSVYGGSLTGSPTSATFGVWRQSDGSIDKIATITIALADIAASPPVVVDFMGEQVWILVESFAAGSSPKFTGTIRIRPVRSSLITRAVGGPGLATSAKQDTGNTSLATVATNTGTTATSTTDPTTSVAITKSDSTDLSATVTKGIWVGTGGDVAIKLTGDSAPVTLSNVPSGTFIPGKFARVMSTNTTASNIIGFGG